MPRRRYRRRRRRWSTPMEGRGCATETRRINVGVRRNLKIAVPLKHGFSAFVNVSDQGVRRWP
uniref:Uncharacterized protein n=1 Tax=Oryza rufipogon TaxID=4529 RepID=A0A0E0PUH9_ORYRU